MQISEQQKNNDKTSFQKFRDCIFEIIEKPIDRQIDEPTKKPIDGPEDVQQESKDEPKEDNKIISSANTVVKWSLVTLIILNALAVIFNSVDEIQIRYNAFFYWFELVSIIIFTVEYILRFFTAKNLFPKEKNPYWKYFRSGYAIFDLLVFLPFYFPFFIAFDLRILRLFRLVRMLRVVKLFRYNDSLGIISRVLKKEKEKLFIAFVFILILILVSSSFLYFMENEAQPEKFPNIPATFWWAVSTLTTVGYGDVFPVTILGKLLAGFISILAIGLVALPSGIISAGLIKEIKKEKFSYDPDEIRSFLEDLDKIWKNLDYLCKEISETLQKDQPGLLIQKNKGNTHWGSPQHQGSSITHNNSNNNIFCGLSLLIANTKDNENNDYSFGLSIAKKIIPDWRERIDKEKFSYIYDNHHLYFKIEKEWFLEQTQENNENLRKRIIEILKGVLPLN